MKRGRVNWSVTNIKCRFQVLVDDRKKFFRYIANRVEDFLLKDVSNILTYRAPLCTYVIFSSGHINVCGVRSLKKARRSIENFCSKFPKYSTVIRKCTIDNISISGRLGYNLLESFQSFAERLCLLTDGLPFFDPLKFPAINIRTRRGTIVLFQTGAINIMGLKSKQDMLYFVRLISSKSARC